MMSVFLLLKSNEEKLVDVKKFVSIVREMWILVVYMIICLPKTKKNENQPI